MTQEEKEHLELLENDATKEIEYLKSIIESIKYVPNAFRIDCGDGKFIVSINSKDEKTNKFFEVSAIYESMCLVHDFIKFAFYETIMNCNPVELGMRKDSFYKPNGNEKIALYHVENIVFRVSILWDLLGQVCNVVYDTGILTDKLHYNRYFKNHSQGKKSFEIAKEIYEYIKEDETNTKDEIEYSNSHQYLHEYRNQMSHRVSPNITSMSGLGNYLRPPVLYVLHHAIEDYYKAHYFLCEVINKYLKEHEDWLPEY